jgi:hypothetical protein
LEERTRRFKEKEGEMEKIEEKGGGTTNQHQLVRKSGRENKEMDRKGRKDGKIWER